MKLRMHLVRGYYLLFTVSVLIFSCRYFQNKTIDVGDKSFYPIASSNQYTHDSNEIVQRLNLLLVEHKYEDFFRSKYYSDSTILFIDTILYSPNFSKLAILVIAKNPANRRIDNPEYYWDFNGTCYLAERNKDSLNLCWIGPSFNYWDDKFILSYILRYDFFKKYIIKSSNKDTDYYINYKLFWESEIWEEQKQKQKRIKDFEEMKRVHPENVFEPEN